MLHREQSMKVRQSYAGDGTSILVLQRRVFCSLYAAPVLDHDMRRSYRKRCRFPLLNWTENLIRTSFLLGFPVVLPAYSQNTNPARKASLRKAWPFCFQARVDPGNPKAFILSLIYILMY